LMLAPKGRGLRGKSVSIVPEVSQAAGQGGRAPLAGIARFLALAAMLVQFTASYGHMHPEDFYRLLGSTGPTVIAMPQGDSAPIPAGPDEDGCAICQVMHMAGGAALPPPILLALPSETGAAAPIIAISELLLSPPAYFLFRTRAPPIA
ncbi:MAG: hypothetical protein ABSG66_12255, partial [Stellaceae bacterium]